MSDAYNMVGLDAYTAVIFLSVMAVIVVDQTLTFKLVIYLLGSYVFSWLIGLITPGAPAGIGVREIMLIILMKGQIRNLI